MATIDYDREEYVLQNMTYFCSFQTSNSHSPSDIGQSINHAIIKNVFGVVEI